jgi:hypothetical protein
VDRAVPTAIPNRVLQSVQPDIFYQPRVVFGDPTFGQVFQALPARSIQLGLKFYW